MPEPQLHETWNLQIGCCPQPVEVVNIANDKTWIELDTKILMKYGFKAKNAPD